MSSPKIEASGISKQFGRVQALRNVDLTLMENEVLALLGNNGSGKSTLIKVLVGVHQPDEGTIYIDGIERSIQSPKEAMESGITTVYQDLALVDELSVAKNLFLARYRKRRLGNLIPVNDWGRMREEAEELLMDRLGLEIDPMTKVEYLSGGERQAIAIGRALVTDPDIVIMDEPTSALSPSATDDVLELIENLRANGLSIIVISHNIPEVFSVADRFSVLLNGELVGTVEKAVTDEDGVKEMMVSGTVPERPNGKR